MRGRELVTEPAVSLRQTGHKGFHVATHVKARRQRLLHLDIGELQRHAGLASQNEQLAGHIHAVEIVAGIRLGKAVATGDLGGVGEGHPFVQLAEDKGERTGQHAVEGTQLVASLDQVLQVLDDRQAGAHVGLVQELATGLAGGAAQRLVVIERPGVGLLVRGDHVETGGEEVCILDGDGLAGGAIDDHRVDEVALFHQLLHRFQTEAVTSLHQLFTPVGEVQPILVDRHLAAVGDAHHPQAGALLGQYRLLAGNLIHQGRADTADADHEQVDELLAAEEVLVAGLDGFGHLAIPHHRRDGALARTLGDGNDVDGSLGQRGEEAGRHPLAGTHAVTDEGDDRQILHDLQRIQQLVLELQFELALQHLAGLVAVIAVDTEADAVLGG